MAPATPSNPIRIAVLMTDTPIPAVVAENGDYGDIFRKLFTKAAAGLNMPESALSWTKYDVVEKEEYPELNDIDAILITGSKFNAFDDAPWILKLVDFTKKVLAQDRVRITGICFGHQILGRALGAPVVRNKGWEVSVCGVELTEKGKELFGRETLSIQQMHLDIVTDYPEGAEPLGSSPTCKVQGMYRAKRYVSVQGHPEFTGPITTEIVKVRHGLGLFDDAAAAEYTRRANNRHDGIAITEAFLRFLQE